MHLLMLLNKFYSRIYRGFGIYTIVKPPCLLLGVYHNAPSVRYTCTYTQACKNIDASVLSSTLIPLPRPAIAVHPQRPTPWKGIPPLTSASTHSILAIASHPPRQLHPTEIRQTPRHADARAQKTINYGAKMHVASQSRQLRGGGR